MTEEEAKTKSCCGPMQAEHGKTHVVNCIGSACMAWRWESGFPLPNDPPAISERYHGFCGLAGKP